jgi:hypothetical protein
VRWSGFVSWTCQQPQNICTVHRGHSLRERSVNKNYILTKLELSNLFLVEFYWMFSVHLYMNVNNNLQRMHFLYIYYISQHSYMFRSIWTILRDVEALRYVINIQKVHSLEVVIYIIPSRYWHYLQVWGLSSTTVLKNTGWRCLRTKCWARYLGLTEDKTGNACTT